MKIFHLPFCYYPDPVGGTEVYVSQLVQELKKANVENIIVTQGTKTQSYLHEGVLVERYTESKGAEDILDQIYGEGDPVAAEAFDKLLEKHSPDIVHMHGMTRGVPYLCATKAKQRGIPVIFTYHTPTISCQNGSMMKFDEEPCDGEVIAERCAACFLKKRGMPKWAALLIAKLPVGVGSMLAKTKMKHSIITILRMKALLEIRRKTWLNLLESVDLWISLADWTKKVLLLNGCDPQKITVVSHGIKLREKRNLISRDSENGTSKTVRIIFVGRVSLDKGLDIPVEALVRNPDLPIEIDVFGLTQGWRDRKYLADLMKLIGNDKRILMKDSVPNSRVNSLLQEYDYCIIPSRWQETGPLVLLEAFEAGTPVLASDLGGLSEKIKNETNSLLVESCSVDAWEKVLRRVVNDRSIRSKLVAQIERPKSMTLVAEEVTQIYKKIMSGENESIN